MNICLYTKIYLSILSGIIVYIVTNLSKKSNYNTNNKFINFFFHDPGTVCPFGILLGKLTIILIVIQIYYLYNNKYDINIKNINKGIVLLGIIFGFLNIPVLVKCIPAFILQLMIIYG